MDYKLEIKNPSTKYIEDYLNTFYEVNSSSICFKGENNILPMVEIQDICIRNKENYFKAKEEIETILEKTNKIQFEGDSIIK